MQTTKEKIEKLKGDIQRFKDSKREKDHLAVIKGLEKKMGYIESLILAERDPEILKQTIKLFRDELVSPLKEILDGLPISFPKSINIANEVKVANQPKSIEVSNLQAYPKEIKVTNQPKEVTVKNPTFSQMVKELGLIKASLTKIYSATGKAVVTGDLKIINTKPADAIPVRLVTPDGKSFYAAITQLLGGSGASETKIKNASGAIINPATNEKIDTLIAAVGGASTDFQGGAKTVVTAGVAVPLSAVSVPCRRVNIRCNATNTGFVYIGGATVSSTIGLYLQPMDSIQVEIDDLNKIYLDASTDGQGVVYVYEA